MEITIYRNKRNPNKYIEVHTDNCYHNSLRQYMYWEKNGVKNYTGDGKLHRWRKENLNELLRDYKKVA